MTNTIALVGFLPATLLGAAIAVPLSGVLVRYRANYAKRIQLDGETGSATHTEVKGYFAMMKRVYKLEGWAGLYKGFMPAVLGSILAALFGLLIPVAAGLQRTPLHTISFQALFTFFFGVIVGIPVSIITNRAICTPYVLPFFSPKLALCVLLTPTERRRPWTLYCTPGLFFVHILTFIISFFVVGIASRLVGWTAISSHEAVFKGLFMALYAVLLILASVLIAPLQVVTLRLSLQRNHDDNVAEGQPRTEAEQASHLKLREYSPDTDVMGFRNEFDPYMSLYDCVTRMKQEEGWKVFYRAYWVTLIFHAAGAGLSIPAL